MFSYLYNKTCRNGELRQANIHFLSVYTYVRLCFSVKNTIVSVLSGYKM